MTSHVFDRAGGRRLPMAVDAKGVWIEDAAGRRYLDAAGGAIVNGVGHAHPIVIEAIARQLATVDYVHAHAFSTEVLESYAAALGEVVPIDSPRVFPVSGGSEAAETAIKLARTYHLAGGDERRTVVLARSGSYHGNTLGALDASGRLSLREGYEPWLGRFGHLPPANEYRCPNPDHPEACGRWHARLLEETIHEIGRDRIAAFLAEPIVGATLGAVSPPPDYWPAVAEVCRANGVLLIADEVMTGFGRTGAWFASDHFSLRPDIVIGAKGASSGYWPLGLCVASGDVWERSASLFRHGFTYSHHPAGAAAGLAVLQVLKEERLVERSARMGTVLMDRIEAGLGSDPHVGDIRGEGLLVAVEFVAQREGAVPFERSESIAESIVAAAMAAGLVVYPVTGCADGHRGDGVLLGPPFIVTEEEIDLIVERLLVAVETVLG